jgi:hypothetical protein
MACDRMAGGLSKRWNGIVSALRALYGVKVQKYPATLKHILNHLELHHSMYLEIIQPSYAGHLLWLHTFDGRNIRS